MTVIPDQIEAGAGRAGYVIGSGGRLAALNKLGILDPLDVHAATAVARLSGETDELVILAAALAVRGTRIGHVCVRLDDYRSLVGGDDVDPAVAGEYHWPRLEEWRPALEGGRMVGDGTGPEPLVMVEDRLYLERYYRYENLVLELMESRIEAGSRPITPRTRTMLGKWLSAHSGLADSQHYAAVEALTSRLTIVAGGPGTGKTFLLGRMLVALAELPTEDLPRVALCAPTGKAAARLGEEVTRSAESVGSEQARDVLRGLSAGTIHRLLGWAPGRGRFAHHSGNRLPHDLVVVDEMSMVSLPLFAKLLAAVRDEAGVVLVGDPFQLESIEVGTVLADLVGPAAGAAKGSAGATPMSDRVVVLERVHRFAEHSPISEFAAAVRQGDADRGIACLRAGGRSIEWVDGPDSEEFRGLLKRVVDHRFRLVTAAIDEGRADEAMALLGDLAVLCANREGAGSVAEWRRRIEEALKSRFPRDRFDGEWYPGRPVMITANDYHLNVFNGDMGVTVADDGQLRVVFDGDPVRSFSPSHLGDHVTVHALTIHKSQGSQFKEVVVSLPPTTESRLLTRQLLYTAVTRASERVIVVGSETVIRRAIEMSVQRASGLRARLWAEQ